MNQERPAPEAHTKSRKEKTLLRKLEVITLLAFVLLAGFAYMKKYAPPVLEIGEKPAVIFSS